MPNYFYIAKSLKGEEKSGTMEAKSKLQLAQTLKAQGFILISAELEREEVVRKKLEFSLPFFDKVSLTDKLMFTRNLQVMVASGLSLPKALTTLAEQTKSQKFKKTLLEISEEITKGKHFSDCLGKYPNIFSELFQNMIKVAEEAGNLDEVLKILSRQMERENELRTKIKGALMYPAVIITAMIGIGALMLIMVVPQLAETFEELEIELPLTTRLVIGIGTFLAEKWFFALPILIGFFIILKFILKTKKGKKVVDTIFLKIPVISQLVKKTNSAYTVRTLGSLIAAGVPIVKSLKIVSGTLGNIHYQEAISEVAEKVGKGSKLSEAIRPYRHIYPATVIQMIQVGEETGETSQILSKLADFFEEEVGNATKNLASIVEPVLMLIIGAVIGFFAISMVQPMYSMLGAI